MCPDGAREGPYEFGQDIKNNNLEKAKTISAASGSLRWSLRFRAKRDTMPQLGMPAHIMKGGENG
jgi:hypothetical protein